MPFAWRGRPDRASWVLLLEHCRDLSGMRLLGVVQTGFESRAFGDTCRDTQRYILGTTSGASPSLAHPKNFTCTQVLAISIYF